MSRCFVFPSYCSTWPVKPNHRCLLSNFSLSPPGCQDFAMSFFIPSLRVFSLLGVGEISRLLTNFKISPVFRVCISLTRKVARSVLVWLALHNSGPNTLISFKQTAGTGLLTNCSKFYNFLACSVKPPRYFYCFSLTTSLLITSAERSSQTWVFSRWFSPPTFPVSPVEVTR